MKFLTTTDGAKRLIEADSAQQAAAIAERESEGAAQVICLRNRPIQVGDTVRCGVYVCGEWKPTSLGVVVAQSLDRSMSDVDIMSLHGGKPWVLKEQTSHLRLEPDDECHCAAKDMPFGRCCKVIAADRFGPVETTNWPFPSSSNSDKVPATVLVGEALL